MNEDHGICVLLVAALCLLLAASFCCFCGGSCFVCCIPLFKRNAKKDGKEKTSVKGKYQQEQEEDMEKAEFDQHNSVVFSDQICHAHDQLNGNLHSLETRKAADDVVDNGNAAAQPNANPIIHNEVVIMPLPNSTNFADEERPPGSE